MDIERELVSIGSLIDSANKLRAVKYEVQKVMSAAKVIGGKWASGHSEKASGFDAIIIHTAKDEEVSVVTRRLRAKNMKVENIDTITERIIGVKYNRRSK